MSKEDEIINEIRQLYFEYRNIESNLNKEFLIRGKIPVNEVNEINIQLNILKKRMLMLYRELHMLEDFKD